MSKEDDKRLSYKNTRFVELKKYWIRWLVKWRPNLFNEWIVNTFSDKFF